MIERFAKVVRTAALICPVPICSVTLCSLTIGLITICLMTICLPAGAHAQQAPPQPQAQQAPAPAKPDATQDNTEVEVSSSRRVKPKDYKNWTFNVGGGSSLPHGTTDFFVRGGGIVADAGAARNFSKYFGLRMDASWTDLPLRTSALRLAQAPGATNHVYGLTIDPIIYIPATKVYSGYVLIGPGFYHRSGKLDSSTAVPGSSCNAFWGWWGTCLNGSLPLGTFLKESQNEFGLNYGGGIARKVTRKIDIYAEYRAQHGSHNNNTTDTRTLTVGARW
jgi:opacity protein-like surface antigen